MGETRQVCDRERDRDRDRERERERERGRERERERERGRERGRDEWMKISVEKWARSKPVAKTWEVRGTCIISSWVNLTLGSP